VTVDPTGAFVYLAGYGGLYSYSINQNSTDFGGGGFPPKNLYGGLTLIPRLAVWRGFAQLCGSRLHRYVSLLGEQVVQ